MKKIAAFLTHHHTSRAPSLLLSASSSPPSTIIAEILPSTLLSVEVSASYSSPGTTIPSATFEPVAPDTTTLIGFGVLLAICVVAGLVWNNSVVPISRSKLAISKSRGEVREYLDDLAGVGSSSSSTIIGEVATLDELSLNMNATLASKIEEESPALAGEETNDRSFEKWLFNDWLTDNKSKKAPAIPILKEAKWNSGDNPVVVTSALMVIGILVASVTERVVR